MENMGTRLKRLRRENDLTQEDVGKYIGVKKAAINKYENGNVENIKRSAILKLSKLYGVNPSYLLCFDDCDYNFEDCSVITNLYSKLDIEDRAEIKGEIKQMLKAEKYTKTDDINIAAQNQNTAHSDFDDIEHS